MSLGKVVITEEFTPPRGVCMNPPRLDEYGCQDCQYWSKCTQERKNPRPGMSLHSKIEIPKDEETSLLPKFSLDKKGKKGKKTKKRRKKGV